MTKRDRRSLTPSDDLIAAGIEADPQFAEAWERLALARLVAAQLIRYRSGNGLSQRRLAGQLGVSQPRVVELESGEKNPTLDTLVKIVGTIGCEIAIDIVPKGATPMLVVKAARDTPAHVYNGASVLVAAR